MWPRSATVTRFRFSLEAKFVAIATAIILVVAVAGSRLLFAHEERRALDEVRGRAALLLESLALGLAHGQSSGGGGVTADADLLDAFMVKMGSGPELAAHFVRILDHTGRVVAQAVSPGHGSSGGATGRSHRAAGRDWGAGQGVEVVEVATSLPGFAGSQRSLVLGVSLERLGIHLSRFGSRLALLATVASLAAVLGAFLVARALARPIKRLAAAMSRVALPLETELSVDRGDEIGLLQASFVEMLERLRAAQREEEKIREAMVRAEKLASIGYLASGVAHEINNPLGGIKNCLVQMEAHPEDRERADLYVGLMHGAVDRIGQIIRGLLDFSRQRELKLAAVAVPDVLTTAVPLVAYRLEKNGIDIDVDLPPDLPQVVGDQHQLEQVLVNLILNAVDALEEGGRVFIRGRQENGSVRLCVEDTGPGIPPDLRERVFDPFFTTKEVGRGTGLGLPVALSIVRAHGGDLSLSSGSGRGAAFTVTLPRVPDGEPNHEEHAV